MSVGKNSFAKTTVIDKLTESRLLTTVLSDNLQILRDRIMENVENVDSTEPDDIAHCNEIILKVNDLIDAIAADNKGLKKIPLLSLTDECGKVVKKYSDWVVKSAFESSEKTGKIVVARTAKEALIIYSRAFETTLTSIQCLGLYENDLEMLQCLKDSEKLKQV